ncbi:hypothetical protein Glove_116g35 [Diversispora epigaea]|uniref:Uncharacterized protein n=1 Tax=Diversispora epigaea TaxID=1348612 RepID=A0A397JAX5_9GLOM|nr:hypothetical protein Glove_116g35 [Diversispora epigaea]
MPVEVEVEIKVEVKIIVDSLVSAFEHGKKTVRRSWCIITTIFIKIADNSFATLSGGRRVFEDGGGSNYRRGDNDSSCGSVGTWHKWL